MLAESKTIELKREYSDQIKKTVIAFANSDGGTVYIGINDDGSIRGLPDPDSVMLSASNAIRDAISPDISLFTEYTIEEHGKKPVLAIRVLRGTARPYYLVSKGLRPEGVFVRQGSSTVPATQTAILNMIRETSGDSYEDARSLNQSLSFVKAESFFESRNMLFGDAQKRSLQLIGDDGTYTNLALLLSDQCPHTIKLAVFEGGQKSLFLDRREFTGSLLSQLEDAFNFIDLFNRTRAEFRGLDRVDMRDYPPQAVREAMLNAIVHRDYSFSSPTLISLFDNRMEFVTVGGLVKGISFDDIMLGISVLRNRHLANVFYRLKLIEAYGTGILKINEYYRDQSDKPRIEVTDNAFKITLPNMNHMPAARAPKNEVQYSPVKQKNIKAVLDMFENNDLITRKKVEETLNTSQSSAIVLLRDMVESGFLQKVGKGRGLSYRLAETSKQSSQ